MTTLAPTAIATCTIVLMLVSPALLCAADVRSDHENPNEEFGKGSNYRLVGDAKFGWRTGVLTGDLDLNGHAFVMDTGGGNYTVFSGEIAGTGAFEWRSGGVPQVAPSILSGDRPNTFQGIFTLSQGVLDLDKPVGVDAIPGDLVIGTTGHAVVRLNRPNQISDTSHVTLGGPGVSCLDLQGHDEKVASLTLLGHAVIALGNRPVSLIVGDSRARSWDLTKTLTIRGYKLGKNSDDPKIEQFAAITRQVAQDTATTLVDLRRAYVAYLQNNNAQLRVDGTLYCRPSGILTYDGVHPSGQGVALLANLISDGILRALAMRDKEAGR